MEIKQREIQSISPYSSNAKKHPDKQVQQIADSIREFGFNQPIVVDKAGVIIVGHGRYLAAKLLKLALVPVLEMDVTEEQARAYRLADNKLNESDWDMELVLPELKLLPAPLLKLTGFDESLLSDTPINLSGDSEGGSKTATPKCTVCGEKVMCESCDDENL